MLINVWSTPRTGSTHYSLILSKQYQCVWLNELFNPYLMNGYYFELNGQTLNYNEYIDGAFYYQYFVEGNCIHSKRVYQQRLKSVTDEELYRKHLLLSLDLTKTALLLHNHVSPIRSEIYDFLFKSADRNIFVSRRDKLAQLASYAIAYSTKKFTMYNEAEKATQQVADIDPIHLTNLITRIKKYDDLIKPEEVFYEDIHWPNQSGFPIKQVDSYQSILSDKMLQIINDLVSEYYREKLSK